MSASTKYIHPDGLKLLEAAFKLANLRPVIVQTLSLSNADKVQASAGTHNQAGTYRTLLGKRVPYSACVDVSVHQPATRLSDGAKVAMTEERIKWLLYCFSECKTVAWYRRPEEGFDAAHIHIITASVPIGLLIVQNQVIDYCTDRTGLKGHAKESYWHASPENDLEIARAFAKANPIAATRLPRHLGGLK